MKYALWRLKLEQDGYLSGPETAIYEAGGYAEASSWIAGEVENQDKILGYVTGDFSIDLSAWSYEQISQTEALAFCQAINPDATILENGKIG